MTRRSIWKANVKMYIRGTFHEVVNYIKLPQGRAVWVPMKIRRTCGFCRWR